MLVEPWHFERDASRDQHRNRPASSSSTPLQTTEETDDEGDNVNSFYFGCTDGEQPFRYWNAARGASRKIDRDEWTALRALQRGAVPKLPLTLHMVSPYWYEKLVELGTY